MEKRESLQDIILGTVFPLSNILNISMDILGILLPGTIIFSNKLYINEFSNSILATKWDRRCIAGIVAGLVAQDFKKF